MRILLYTLILSTLALNFNYCDCFPLNARTIEKLKEKSDLIAIGFPTEIIASENNYEEDIVVFQIDSLIKGKNLNSRTILINQNQAGNCANYFELCEQYVITGEKVQNVKQTYNCNNIILGITVSVIASWRSRGRGFVGLVFCCWSR